MLAQITIVTPSANTPFPGGRRFYVTGFAPAGVEAKHLYAVLFDLDSRQRVAGNWVWATSNAPTGQTRWIGLFADVLPDARYAVLVTAITGEAMHFSFPRLFRVATPPGALKAINVLSHSDNDNITDQAELFIASGSLQGGHTATTVTMNSLNGDVENMTEVEPPSWVAFFEPLALHTNYTLTANDSGSHSDVVTPLIVN